MNRILKVIAISGAIPAVLILIAGFLDQTFDLGIGIEIYEPVRWIAATELFTSVITFGLLVYWGNSIVRDRDA